MKTSEIASLISGKLKGSDDIEIDSAAAIDGAGPGQLAFFDGPGAAPPTRASCLITRDGAADPGPERAVISTADPKTEFARVARLLHPAEHPRGIHPTAVVAEDALIAASFIGAAATVGARAELGEDCAIYEGVRIGRDVKIGRRTVIYPNCVLYDGVSIGSNCVLHAGVIVGAPGFGYVRSDGGEYETFPQIGTVVIEDRVEIGANTCVDRAALGETRIATGTKIDNLVQVGHNVVIGKRCVIAAQTGISGSVVIEDDCVIGGQVGFGDHALVKSGAVIGSQAGVLPGKIVRPGTWWGTPVQPLDEVKRQHAHLRSLERLKAEVREIRRLLDKDK
jgi:UDP-3-O-[3-hydroxymyristoyl] glucosamine N-acyltransferase